MGKHAESASPQRSSLKRSAASHTTTSWRTDTDGFLEHSPTKKSLYFKGPALQRIITGFFESHHEDPKKSDSKY